MKDQNSLFFVQLKEPADIRRDILETLKDIVIILQKLEKFKDMRQKKFESIQKLRLLMRQANKMMGELKGKLPQTELKPVILKERASIRRPEPQQKKPSEQPKKREMTELEKLEAELGDIEGKLRSLQ